MQFGDWRVELLETGSFALDGGAMFGVVPKNLWSKAYDPGDEQNRIPMAARALYLERGERRIVVDTGNGNKFSEKFGSIYNIDRSVYTLERSLAAVGSSPEAVTDVILTHLHFDHAGGATVLDGARPVPAFPNARYFVQAEQLAWAREPSVKDRASFMAEDFEPLAAAGVLEALNGEQELIPGIRLLPVNGHTRHLQMVQVRSQGQTLLFPSDLCPTAAHVRVPFVMGYDNFPLSSIEEKERYWKLAVAENWLIVFQHDAFRQAAYIAEGPKGYEAGSEVMISAGQD